MFLAFWCMLFLLLWFSCSCRSYRFSSWCCCCSCSRCCCWRIFWSSSCSYCSLLLPFFPFMIYHTLLLMFCWKMLFPLVTFSTPLIVRKHCAFTSPKKGLCHKCHRPTLPLSEQRIDCARPVRTQGLAKVFLSRAIDCARPVRAQGLAIMNSIHDSCLLLSTHTCFLWSMLDSRSSEPWNVSENQRSCRSSCPGPWSTHLYI